MAKTSRKSKTSDPSAAASAVSATAPAPSAAVPAAAGKTPALTVRHYCQGIGDCHLLTFRKNDGSLFRMLIDCGIHSSVSGGSDLIRDIAADVKAASGGKIDVLVVTHEHWDHVSGFLNAAAVFSEGFTVGEVWMAWSENPKDPDAIAFDKFKGEALSALQGASLKLDADRDANSYLSGLRDGLQSVMGFQFGAAGEKVRAARNAAAALSKNQPPVYLGPETAPFSVPGLPNVRIYVLGPPRKKDALRLETQASEMYPLAGQALGAFLRPLSAGLAAADNTIEAWVDDALPFDPHIGTDLAAVLAGDVKGDVADFVRSNYSKPLDSGRRKPKINDDAATDQSWRRIDADWLGLAADLAMQLDRGVNNTSLVLAFEMLDTKRVFLFPGDAQVGSWLSWQDVKWTVDEKQIDAPDLMARTVFLKVAHHGSQNATLEKKGLDLMIDPDLSAFIPTNKQDAKHVGWGEMPYDAILNALETKTSGRVIRADDEWLATANGAPGFPCPSGSVLAVRSAVRDPQRGEGGLWVELDLA